MTFEEALQALADAVHKLQAERALLATDERSVLSSIDAIRNAKHVLTEAATLVVKLYEEKATP